MSWDAGGLSRKATPAQPASQARFGTRPRISGRQLAALVMALALRDVTTRYKQSFLGLYWAIINPFLTALIFSLVFGAVLRSNPAGTVPYAVFLVVNLTFWNFFANSITSATISVASNGPLISKIYFPRLVIPTAAVVARLVDFAFSAGAAALFMLIYGVHIGWTLPVVLVPLVALFLLATGCAYLLSALHVLYRDTAQIIAVVTMLWMYVSPVMYTIGMLPHGLQGWLALNPVAGILEFVQAVVLQRTWPGWASLSYSASVACGVVILGAAYFRHAEDTFGEIM